MAREEEIPTQPPPRISDADWARMRTDYQVALDAYSATASAIADSLARGDMPSIADFDREVVAGKVLAAARHVLWHALFGATSS